MEAVGLTASIISLASLFTSCVDAFAYFRAGQALERDLELLLVKLDIEKARLLSWGNAVGIVRPLHEGRNELFQHAGIEATVGAALKNIHVLLTDSAQLRQRYAVLDASAAANNATTGASSAPPIEFVSRTSMQLFRSARQRYYHRLASIGVAIAGGGGSGGGGGGTNPSLAPARRIAWAIRDRERFRELLTDLRELIDGLVHLTPSGGESATDRIIADEVATLPIARLRLVEDACRGDERYQSLSDAASEAIQASEAGTVDERRVEDWLADQTVEITSTVEPLSSAPLAKSQKPLNGFYSSASIFFMMAPDCRSSTSDSRPCIDLESVQLHRGYFTRKSIIPRLSPSWHPGHRISQNVSLDDVLGVEVNELWRGYWRHHQAAEAEADADELQPAHDDFHATIFLYCSPCTSLIDTAVDVCNNIADRKLLRRLIRIDDRIRCTCLDSHRALEALQTIIMQIQGVERAGHLRGRELLQSRAEYVDRDYIEGRIQTLEDDEAVALSEAPEANIRRIFGNHCYHDRVAGVVVIGEVDSLGPMMSVPPYAQLSRMPKERELYVSHPRHNDPTPWKQRRIDHKLKMLVPSAQFDAYTVGFICALPFELAAVRAMMDECHGRPSDTDPADSNSYFLGRIGEHNVVAACLPSGSSGTVSAATVAAHMQLTFKSIRFGLAVGVGSGVADASNNMHLGDVIVSVPDSGTSGVVQFDFCEAFATGKFVPTSALDKPPKVLLTALTSLRADHMVEDSRISELLADAAEGNRKVQALIARPPDYEDRLFLSHATHPDGAQSCATCDASMSVDRPARGSNSPAIHYGVIASGSQVIHDAAVRDKLKAQHNVLCCETEAAGLMDNFPCLVVRGVCDYADSHRNDKWKTHAAFAAAAFAKELLSVIPTSQVQQTPTVLETLKDVAKDIQEVRTALDVMRDRRFIEDKDRRHIEILDWLTAADYDAVQQDCYGQREGNTGQWLLSSAEFCSWIAPGSSNATLFCPGIPGAGKTIMASIVIEHLRALRRGYTTGIAFVYCNYKKHYEQALGDLIAVILKQLCAHCPEIPSHVAALYDRHKRNRSRPAVSDLAEALRYAVGAFDRVYVVVDALDECDSSYWSSVIAQLRSLQCQDSDVRLFVTARHETALEQEFSRDPQLEIRAHPDDLKVYLLAQMPLLSDHVKRDASLQELITSEVITAADGMFLLAKLHVDSLFDKRTPNDIKAALKLLPKGQHELAAAYDKAIDRIQCQRRDDAVLARKVLSWIARAQRPLGVDELLEALAVRLGDTALDPGNFYLVSETVKVCAGLVARDPESNVIRLIHHTTQAYFEDHRIEWLKSADAYIASTCLTYLSFQVFAEGPCEIYHDVTARLAANQLVSYAAVYWGYHTRKAQGDVEAPALRFLTNLPLLRSACQLEYWLKDNFRLAFDPSATFSGLHCAARLGFDKFIPHFFGRQSDIDVKDILGRTALSYAAEEGHDKVAKLLLSSASVCVNAQDTHGLTPLAWAASKGRTAVVELLLNCGETDVNARCSDDRTALHLAAEKGHGEVLRLLLNRADVQVCARTLYGLSSLDLALRSGHGSTSKLLFERLADDNDFWGSCFERMLETALATSQMEFITSSLCQAKHRAKIKVKDRASLLLRAAEEGSEAFLKFLLDHTDCDTNAKDQLGRSALSLAAGKGHEAIVQVLLNQADVNANATDSNGANPILSAAERGHDAVVQLLLDRADVHANATDSDGFTPLLCAAWWGYEAVVKRLLDRDDVDVNAIDSDGLSPLMWAACGGHEAVVKLLLDRADVDVNAIDSDGDSSLICAASFGHEAVVKLLLDRADVDVNTIDSDGRSSLMWAACERHEAVVKLLIERADVDVNATDSDGDSPLMLAACEGNEAVVKLLLHRADVDVDKIDGNGNSPLICAASWGYEAVVKLLLHRADVDANAMNFCGSSPLLEAARCGQTAVVGLLLDNADIDGNALDYWGRNAVSHAAENGHCDVAKLLLNRRNVDVNKSDDLGRRPLMWAAMGGHVALSGLLLDLVGVDVNAHDCFGRTALSWAAEVGSEAVVKLLLSHGSINPDEKDDEGRGPISWAAENGHAVVVQLLLDIGGVDSGRRDALGWNPLTWAVIGGHTAVERLFRDRGDANISFSNNSGFNSSLPPNSVDTVELDTTDNGPRKRRKH